LRTQEQLTGGRVRSSRSFQRRWYRASIAPLSLRARPDQSVRHRREHGVLATSTRRVGGFEAGTDILSRVLDAGHTVVYEPPAIAWSRAWQALPEFVAPRQTLVQRLLSVAGDALRTARRRRAASPSCEVREARRHVDLAEPLRPIADAPGDDRLLVTVS